MQLSHIVVLSFLGLVSAQIDLPDPDAIGSSIASDASSVGTEIGSGIDQATSAIGSGISTVDSAVTSATDAIGSGISSVQSTASDLFGSATDAATAATTGSDNPAPIQTAAVGLGALFGGAAVLANL